MSSPIYHSFSENCTIHQFGNIFFEFFFSFVLALCLYQCIILTKLLDWIKWNIYYWTFLNTNLWFNACFKFPMCITYSFLWCKLATIFPIFIKLINLCEGHVIFYDIEHRHQENILYYYHHYNFLWIIY